MTSQQERIQSAFDRLHQELSFGWLYICTAKHLQTMFQQNQLACGRYFFISAYQACLDQSLLILSRLLYTTSENGSFQTILQAAQTHSDAFPYAAANEIQNCTKDSLSTLEKTAARVHQLQSLHNPSVADFEKIREDDAAFARFFASNPLEEIAQGYRALMKELNTYYAYFQNAKLHFRYLEEEVNDDIGFLMTLLSGNCI